VSAPGALSQAHPELRTLQDETRSGRKEKFVETNLGRLYTPYMRRIRKSGMKNDSTRSGTNIHLPIGDLSLAILDFNTISYTN
jgi:hypothetical protein